MGPKRTKLGISDAQKQALRAFWSNTSPKPTQTACAKWFEDQFKQVIDRSTISRILSSKYNYLDTGPAGQTNDLHPLIGHYWTKSYMTGQITILAMEYQ